MTRDEIVQIAWDVGILMRSHQFQDEPTKLEQFAERIAAAEREACARLCDENGDKWADGNDEWRNGQATASYYCAIAIRARGEV